MNPVLRKRIPACVRTLLTDIEPKGKTQYCNNDKDDDDEVVPINRDGVTLPGRGSAKDEELLAPAGGSTEDKHGVTSIGTESRVCGLCLTNPVCYTCPRCNTPYCSMACYQSPAHSICSEEFYKESVFQELKSTHPSEVEGKKQMQEILMRLRDKENEEGMEDVLTELEEGGHGRIEDNRQVFKLLSRLAEIQASGVEDRQEVEDILTKLTDVGGQHVDDITKGQRDLEELGVKEEEDDLAKKLSGLDLDSLSEEQLWALLPQQDKERFEGLVKEGAIGGLVPLWKPWWERHEEGRRALMEMLEDVTTSEACSQQLQTEKERAMKKDATEANKTDRNENNARQKSKGQAKGNQSYTVSTTEQKSTKMQKQKKEKTSQGLKSREGGEGVPPISSNIPPLHSLSSHISPLIRYNLVNALYGYTFSLHLYNGDLSDVRMALEFCHVTLAVSESLSSSHIFGSIQEALRGGEMAVVRGGFLDQRDVGASSRTVQAVAHVLTGRSAQDQMGYSLAALSQLRDTLTWARKRLSSEGEEGETRRMFFFARKKCEFLQSWVKENGPDLRWLAREVWTELAKRERDGEVLEKERKEIENSWKKGQGRKKRVVIEEID